MANNQLFQQLQILGLSSAEAAVYLSCLESGGAVVSTIAQVAKVERTNCYYILKTLGSKGLISTTNKGNVRYYLAEPAEKIVQQQKQKLSLAEQILPQLVSIEQNVKGASPRMRYFEGMEGISSLLARSLGSTGELLCYTNIKLLMEKFPDILLVHFREQAKTEVHCRIISRYNLALEKFPEQYFPDEYINRCLQLLFINPKEFSLQNNILIYDDKVSMISLKSNEYLGVLIESESYAETSRTIFNLAWLGASSFVAN